MKLLTLVDLLEENGALPEGFGLVSGSKQLIEIDDVLSRLREKAPGSLLNFFHRFELQGDSFGLFWFGSGRSLSDEIWSRNDPSGRKPRWWGGGERKQGDVMIAANDGFVISLNLSSGRIFAFSRDESVACSRVIASDFESFIRGAGTAYVFRDTVQDGDELATFVATAVGSGSEGDKLFFWRDTCY